MMTVSASASSTPSTPTSPSTSPMHARLVVAAWLFSDIASLFGSALSGLAVPWMVLNLTHNTAATGIVSAVQLGTLVAANLVSGPLIDKLGPTRISISCDIASACCIALIPLLWFLHLFSIPALIVIVAVVGALRGPANSSKSVLSPSVAQFSKQPMERITGLSGTTERMASTIGSAAGGVIIGVVGGPYALVFTSLGLIIGAILTATIVRPALLPLISASQTRTVASADAESGQGARSTDDTRQPDGQTDAASAHSGANGDVKSAVSRYGKDLAAGWKSLMALPVVFGLTLIPAITNMIDIAWTDVLTPAWVLSQHLGSQTLGMLFASLTFPAMISSLIATVLASRLPRFPVFIIGYLLVGAPRYLAMAFNAPTSIVVATLIIGGVGSGFLNPILSAIIYERIPGNSRGKIISLTSAISWGLMPIGSLLGGFMSHILGLNITLGILGIAYLIITMLPLFVPALRHFERITPETSK
ncbi:MFS transporter [Bifidobacterium crudilactis]|uniref:MFS transporter n=1 Tax=Bifidobacterium crudilactis TaxID=327277 RepID=UPI003A5BC834